MIVVAICSIQCIWISVSPCPQNVDNGNVMGVIERKPPSSFSRRSSSGNGGFEHYHPPVQSFPFASRTLHPTSTPSSIQPRSFSLIPFHLPIFLRHPSSLFLLLRLPSLSYLELHYIPFLPLALHVAPSPLFSSFSHRLPPTHTALHTRSLSDSSTPPLPLSLPLIPEFHPRGEPLRQPLFSSL